MEYNSQRPHLLLKEYGRNIQKLILKLLDIEDREERSKKASTLVALMKIINSNINKESAELDQKVWDDLHIISNFELDIDSEYPKPLPESIGKKPDPIEYVNNRIKYRHYGNQVNLLIQEAKKLSSEEEKAGAIVSIGRIMKDFHQNWGANSVDDEQILKNLKELSDNELDWNIDQIKELGLFNSEKRVKRSPRVNTKYDRKPNGQNKNKKPYQKNNNNNNRRRVNT